LLLDRSEQRAFTQSEVAQGDLQRSLQGDLQRSLPTLLGVGLHVLGVEWLRIDLLCASWIRAARLHAKPLQSLPRATPLDHDEVEAEAPRIYYVHRLHVYKGSGLPLDHEEVEAEAPRIYYVRRLHVYKGSGLLLDHDEVEAAQVFGSASAGPLLLDHEELEVAEVVVHAAEEGVEARDRQVLRTGGTRQGAGATNNQ
jgi:hypothetical protein